MTNDQIAHFYLCIARGCSERLATMLALGRPPAAMTDSVFLAGFGANGGQFDGMEAVGDFYRGKAEAEGQQTKGAVYLSGLARYPGDPEAWIRSRGDVARVLDARGWGAEGAVNRPVREVAETWQPYQVASDIVAARAEDLCQADPSLTKEAAQEKAREQLSPNWGQATDFAGPGPWD
jgi:hypothetical protein